MVYNMAVRDVYSSIPSSVLSFFNGYYVNFYNDQDYVIVRLSQTSYAMYVGDVDVRGTLSVHFTNCDVITYYTNTTSYDQPYFKVSKSNDVNVDVSNGLYSSPYVYSNVIGTASITIAEHSASYHDRIINYSILVCICFCMLFVVIRRWFTRHDRKS